ncbi:MAG: S9 family peptidase [Candidatus Dormibacteraceae bacterium]
MPDRSITAQDLEELRWVDRARLSPDGSGIAYQVGFADSAEHDNGCCVWFRNLEGDDPPQRIAEGRRSHSPQWSPDGNAIAYLARCEGRDQIFIAERGANWNCPPRRLTAATDGCASFCWAPDGSQVAFLSFVPSEDGAVVDDPRPHQGEDRQRRPPVARRIRRLDDKHDGMGFVDGRHPHLFLIPAAGGRAQQLTQGAFDVEGFDWSPDGRKLVVCGDFEPDSDLRRTRNLYLVDAEGAAPVRIAGGLEISNPCWSPEGDLIAFVAPAGPGAGLFDRAWVVAAAGGEPKCLTAGLDRSVGGSVGSDMRGGHGVRLLWSRDGDRLYFIASGPGTAEVCSVTRQGEVRIEHPAARSVAYDFDLGPSALAVCVTDPLNPGEIELVEGGAARRLTDLNPWLRDRHVAYPEEHWLTTSDGLRIQGWLLRPSDFDDSGSFPLVMQIHGGPHGQYGWAFFHEFQILASLGMLVFYTNPPGSEGYGEAFCQAVVRDWGGADFEALMQALDQILERVGGIDETRLGIAGGSYGGYLTNWAIGHTNRFAAAVSMRSISNLVSEYAQHDIVLWGALELGPAPWPDLDELWRRSPIRYVRSIHTPLLLLHGEMDLRCAISQSEELFGALRLLGRRVEMVRYPGESHDLSRSGRPDRRIDRLNRIGGFFSEHLLR